MKVFKKPLSGKVCPLLIALFIFTQQPCFAQVDVSVDPFTGKPKIFIPLGHISDRDLSYSIGLSYTASGVKVDEGNGLVGTSWELVGTGEVKRELRGLPDDYSSTTDLRKGWLYNNNAQNIGNRTWPLNGAAMSCSTEPTHHNFINGLNYLQDTEPDLFHFSAGGLQGSFVFDNTGSVSNIKTIPYQAVKINVTRPAGTSISQFEIIDNSGVKYTFSIVETTKKDAEIPSGAPDPDHFRKDYHLYKQDLTYNSAWKLTKILSPKGETINFNYTSQEVVSGREVKVAVNKTSSGFVEKVLYQITEVSQKKLLSVISSPTRSISLLYVTKSQTAFSNLLSEVVINEIHNGQSSFLHKNKLEYYSLKSSIDGTSSHLRHFLKLLYLEKPCESLPPYEFVYNSVADLSNTIALPASGSPQQDLWGYYKALTVTHKIPKVYIYPSLAGHKRVSLFPIPGAAGGITIDGADRGSGPTSQAGMLNKIIFPTKGSQSLTYSSHEFLNPVTGAYAAGGGLRVASVSTWDGVAKGVITRSYEYENNTGISTGKLLSLPAYSLISGYYYNPETQRAATYSQISGLTAPEQWKRLLIRTENNIGQDFEIMETPIVYSEVTEKTFNNGKTVYKYDTPALYGSSTSGDWDPTYTHVARSSSCPPSGLIIPGYSTYPFAPSTPYDHNRGLLRQASHFKEGETSPVKETFYDYIEKPINGTVVKGVSYDVIPVSATAYFYMYGVYKLSVNKIKLLQQIREKVRDEFSPAVYTQTVSDFSYGAGHTMLATKAVTNSDGSIWREKFRYARDYPLPTATTYDLQSLMIKELAQANRYGALIESTSTVTPVGGSEVTIAGSLQMFKDFGVSPAKQILPYQVKKIDSGEGLTGFVTSNTTVSGSSLTFNHDSRYRTVSTFGYNSSGNLSSEEDFRKEVRGYHSEDKRNTPVVEIKNAFPDEVIYSSFDHITNRSFDLVGAFSVSNKNASGRTGIVGLLGLTNGQRYLKKSVKNRKGIYTFSTWLKANTASTYHLELTIKTTSGATLKKQTLNCNTQAGKWQAFAMDVDLSTINAPEVIVEVNTTDATFPVTIDDLSFYPKGSDLTTYTFLYPYGASSVTTPNRLTTSYAFDGNGRAKYIFNNEGDILQKYTYTKRADEAQEGVPISIQRNYNVISGVSTTLIANTSCLDYNTLEWKVVPEGGTASYFYGSDEQPYTFRNPGRYTVYLKISHYTYGSFETTTSVNVDPPPLEVTTCIAGPTRVDLCGIEAPTLQNCRISPPPEGYTSFRADKVAGCSGTPTYTYKWYKRAYGTTQSWSLVGTGQVVSVQNTASYEVYCSVTSSNGCQADTEIKSVYVYRSQSNCSTPAQ